MKKLTAMLLAIMMILSLAACGAQDSGSEVTDTDISTGDETVNNSSAGDDDTVTPEEYYSKFENAYAKYDPNTVVMTVNGQDLIWADYFSWMFNIVSQIESYYGEVDWNAEIEEGYTFNDWAIEYAQASSSQYIAIEQGAKAAGITLSDVDREEIQALYESDIETYGGGDVDVFLQMLGEMFITEDYYFYMGEISYYYDNLFAATYGESGNLLSDEDALAFAEDYGYLRAKHILYKTVDDAGDALEESVIAEKKAAADSALAALRAAPDQDAMLTLFDEYIANESEDTGSAYYPDGYYFTDGEMVQEFEDGTKALDMYAVSEVIESPYGYHIILRLPIEPDDIVDAQYGVSLRYAAASYLYGNMISDFTENAVIEYQNGFDALNLNELFY